MKVVAVLCLALLSVAYAQTGFNGVWTDTKYGGELHTCVFETTIYGTYSGIGYIIGELSADGLAAGGRWYEGGLADGNFGTFNWQLLGSDTGFVGIREIDQEECAPATWSETRIGSSGADPEDCLFLFETLLLLEPNKTSINGVWTDNAGNTLNICSDDLTWYEASFSGTMGSGYSHGYAYEEGRLSRGSYIIDTPGGLADEIGVHLFLLTDIDILEANSTELIEIGYIGIRDPRDIDPFTTPSFRRTWTRVTFEVEKTILQNSDGTQSVITDCMNTRSLISNPWSGSWTDFDFGYGRLHICVDGSLISGIYSELGWINGRILSDNSITGRFYDAGDGDQVSGDFHLAFRGDTDHFEGTWEFDNSPKKYTWKEQRTHTADPTFDHCLPLNGEGNRFASGTWRYDAQSRTDTLDICFLDDGSRFEASYNFNDGLNRGYITGFVRENGLALQGEWFEENKQGILMFRLLSKNSLHMIRWNHADIQASNFFVCDDDQGNSDWVKHRSVTFTDRLQANARVQSCKRNDDLSLFAQVGPFTPDDFVDYYLLSLLTLPSAPPPPPPRRRPVQTGSVPPAPPVPSGPPAPPAPSGNGNGNGNNGNDADSGNDDMYYTNALTFVPQSPNQFNEDGDAAAAFLPHVMLVILAIVGALVL